MSGGVITFLIVMGALLVVRVVFLSRGRSMFDEKSAEAMRRVRRLQSNMPAHLRSGAKCASCAGLGYIPNPGTRSVSLCDDCQGTGRAGAVGKSEP